MACRIAVVGISAELPSGSYSEKNLDHRSFFEFLLSKGEAYERIPVDRFNVEAWRGPNPGQISVDRGSFLKGIDLFDNVEFGVSTKDARNMAPSTRKLLENSFLALLDSGIDYRARNVGCFTSGITHDLVHITEPNEFDARGSFAGAPSMVANRVSYHLDLLGPSVPTDTACSSSATALHLAVNALTCGDCEAAVVAGCQLNHQFIEWINYSQGSVLSKDGKCKPFDASADGFARAEGVVAVVLKPLEDALKSGDRVYGTILGTAVNAGGSAAPVSAPEPGAQRLAMLKAFERAERSPKEVDFVECHATGTALGDPTEANWVGESFGRDDELVLGSVKGNIGHTEIVAFLASLSKVLSMFEYHVIPPNVNLKVRNPAIRWDVHKLHVPSDVTDLSCRSGNRSLVAIASSGIGGSNAHIVVEGPPVLEVPVEATSITDAGRPVLLTVGGLSPRSAAIFADSVGQIASANTNLLDALAVKLGRRTRQLTWRSFAVVDGSNISQAQFPGPSLAPRVKPPVVFVFPGQGPQYQEMGRELFEIFPAFRASVLESDRVYQDRTGKSIIHDYGLFGSTTVPAIPQPWPVALTLPSLAIFQVAFFDLLIELGVKPDIVLGHSAGETAVLYASGAGSREMAIELAIARGSAFSSLEALGGTMAALSCTAEEAMELIKSAQFDGLNADNVEVACLNSPSSVAIAGPEVKVDEVLRLAALRDIFGRKIHTRVPMHSSMLDKCHSQYASLLGDVYNRYPGLHEPPVPMYSTLTGELFQSALDAQYFWDNSRSPVRFTQAMDAVLKSNPQALFIELAPHPVLSAYLNLMVGDPARVLAGARRPRKDQEPLEHRTFLQLLGQLTVGGYNSINFARAHNYTGANFDPAIDLPAYPFQPKAFPLYPDVPSHVKQFEAHNGPLNHRYLRINKETHPSLAEHIVRGEPIMPAAGFLEMAFEFGATALMDITFRTIFSLSSDVPVPVSVQLDGSYWSVKSETSGGASAKSSDKLHADGYLSMEIPIEIPSHLDMDAILSRCNNFATNNSIYSSISYAFNYGPLFQRIIETHYNSDEALLKIRGTSSDLHSDKDYLLHPAVLDACFQLAVFPPFHANYDPNIYYLPAYISSVVLHTHPRKGYLPPIVFVHFKLRQWTPGAILYDLAVADDTGFVLCTIQGLEMKKHFVNHLPEVTRRFDFVYQSALFPLPRGEADKDTHRSCPHRLHGVPGCEPCCQIFDRPRENGVIPINAPQLSLCHGPAFLECIDLLRKTLSSVASSDQRRVVNIFIATSNKAVLSQLSGLFSGFPDLFLTYFLSNESQLLDTSPDLATGRVGSIHFGEPLERQGLTSHSFDIALLIEAIPPTLDPSVVLGAVQELLVQGGRLFLVEQSGSASVGPLEPSLEVRSQNPPTLQAWTYLLANIGFRQLDGRYENADTDAVTAGFVMECEYRDFDNSPRLLNEEATHIFQYEIGGEMDLQWFLTGLDPSQHLDIWITTLEGPSADEAIGLARVLRKELLNWKVRVVVFPPSYTPSMRIETLQQFTNHLDGEFEIMISPQGDVIIPHILPLVQPSNPRASIQGVGPVHPRYLRARVLAFSSPSPLRAFIGSVVDSTASQFPRNSVIIGLVESSLENDHILVDPAAVYPYTGKGLSDSRLLASVPGLVVAGLAPSLSVYKRKDRFRTLRVLVTHCRSNVGRVVSRVYSAQGIDLVEVDESLGLLGLSQLGHYSFDLVVSGHTDGRFTKILHTLVRVDTGRVFLWNNGSTSLSTIVKREPWSIGDALECSLEGISDEEMQSYVLDSEDAVTETQPPPRQPRAHGLFRSDKNYLLLGGLGSLGPYVALWMYERGARHIILTSRSGELKYQSRGDTLPLKILRYLRTCHDLQLRLEIFDASNATEMNAFLGALSPAISGCFIMTTSITDGLFLNLAEQDFQSVRKATSGVLDALEECLQIKDLEFLVAFSSVSAAFGNAGQSNYSSAKTVMDGRLKKYKNAFSFVCPPIVGTASVGNAARSNKSLSAWKVSPEEMVRWLEDGIRYLQDGNDLWLYIPDWNWSEMDKSVGMPARIGFYLLPSIHASDTSTSHAIDDPQKLIDIVLSHLDVRPEDFSPEIPLVSFGLDSLSASKLSFALDTHFSIKVSQIQLLANMTTGDLSVRIQDRLAESPEDGTQLVNGTLRDMIEEMQNLLTRYTLVNQIQDDQTKLTVPPSQRVVLITGTTGTLGTNMLHQLVSSPEVRLVYALNRRSSEGLTIEGRQRKALVREGLPTSLLDSPKVRFCDYDLTVPKLGLSEALTEEILTSVTHIIHNAWKSDFTLPVSRFEDLIRGTHALAELALNSRLNPPPFVSFISSVIVCGFAHNSGPTLEEPIDLENLRRAEHLQVSDMSGYAQSKWVSEQIIYRAAETMSLPASVIRVGQISGGPSGAWHPDQWLPAIIKSALFIDCLPDGDGEVSLIPVNVAAAATLDISFGRSPGTKHIVHPQPVPWRTVVESAASIMGVPLVPYSVWLQRLEESRQTNVAKADHAGYGENIALQLLDFFQQAAPQSSNKHIGFLPGLDCCQAKLASSTLGDPSLQQVGKDDVERWLRYWVKIGFLPATRVRIGTTIN